MYDVLMMDDKLQVTRTASCKFTASQQQPAAKAAPNNRQQGTYTWADSQCTGRNMGDIFVENHAPYTYVHTHPRPHGSRNTRMEYGHCRLQIAHYNTQALHMHLDTALTWCSTFNSNSAAQYLVRTLAEQSSAEAAKSHGNTASCD